MQLLSLHNHKTKGGSICRCLAFWREGGKSGQRRATVLPNGKESKSSSFGLQQVPQKRTVLLLATG